MYIYVMCSDSFGMIDSGSTSTNDLKYTEFYSTVGFVKGFLLHRLIGVHCSSVITKEYVFCPLLAGLYG